MNRIEMYSSSPDLRLGLHRVLAVAHALTQPLPATLSSAWWMELDSAEREQARRHTLSLESLATVYGRERTRGMVDHARAAFGLSPLSPEAVHAAFRSAIISGRAHRAHMGRDVYGSSNKDLWDLVCADFGDAVAAAFGPTLGAAAMPEAGACADPSAIALLHTLTEFDTSPAGRGHTACVEWLTRLIVDLGFTVRELGADLGRPLLVAHRPARGLEGHVCLYGHYDVTPFGPAAKWTHPPRQLTVADGRLFARGVADNKGPLACRLAALTRLPETPELTWFIQGEEETGSVVAHALLPDLMRTLRPTLWLDETGYHDHEDGTLRLLGRRMGEGDASLPPDPPLTLLLRALWGLASRWGVAARHELRGLNKSVVEGGCPFNHSLPLGARYLAIGVNDSVARIHGLNESLPEWTFGMHVDELDVVFRWVDHLERSASCS